MSCTIILSSLALEGASQATDSCLVTLVIKDFGGRDQGQHGAMTERTREPPLVGSTVRGLGEGMDSSFSHSIIGSLRWFCG